MASSAKRAKRVGSGKGRRILTIETQPGESWAEFAPQLLGWYDAHKRDLPWRQDRDPYRVWVSEIMLQQTRVAAVMEHYQRFLKKFPTVEQLARARESTVLAAWSGLGYYRRARMLHAAARQVVGECGGDFPRRAEELRALPGIGRYTAAAIASIVFGEAAAVVDGNVERVLQRLHSAALGGEELWSAAQKLLSPQRPGDSNQAMMELGAIVCIPGPPKCLMCPVAAFCGTRGDLGLQKKDARQRTRDIHFSLGRRQQRVFLVQRSEDESLMPGMWELPQLSDANGQKTLLRLRHSITNTDYRVRVVEAMPAEDAWGKWIPQDRLTALALTGLARKILNRAGLI